MKDKLPTFGRQFLILGRHLKSVRTLALLNCFLKIPLVTTFYYGKFQACKTVENDLMNSMCLS